MHRACRSHILPHAKTELRQVKVVKQMLAAPEQDGRDREMHLIDEPGAQILANGRDAAAEPHILAFRRAASMPSVTKWKTVPPSIVIGARS